MTQRRAKLNLDPNGQQKPPPKHAFSDGLAAGDPATARGQRHSGDLESESPSPRPQATSARQRSATADAAEANARRDDIPSSRTENNPTMALPPAVRRLLRHPAVRVGLVSAAAALSIWLLRRRPF
jgi:hypothetical protein